MRQARGLIAVLLGAVLFGVIAYFMTGVGVRGSGSLLLGAMLGAFVGACWGGEVVAVVAGEVGIRLRGSDPMFAALVGGAVLGGGLGGCMAIRSRRSLDPPRDQDEEAAPDQD